MLKIGVQSGGLFYYPTVDENYKNLHDHGFECIDLNVDGRLPGSQIKDGPASGYFDKTVEEICEDYRSHKEAAEKYGIAFSQMHGPFPLWTNGRDNDMNPYLIMATEKCMKLAKYLGCPYIVVHPVSAQYLVDKDFEKQLNLSIYRQLIPAAKETGVKICLENLFTMPNGHPGEGPCSDVSEAIWYIDKLNAEAGFEAFSFCLDIGHANLFGRNLYEYIKSLGSRLGVLHIHDNDGMGDLHMLPYSYTTNSKSSVDWNAMLRGLKAINYKGNLSFETFRCMRFYPREVHGEFLDLLSAIGRYMRSQIVSE